MTSVWAVVALGVAGGLGAVTRFVLDTLLTTRLRVVAYPVGTTVINLTGSLLLGMVTGFAITHAVPAEWRLILGVGFLGGYTTFSTASYETVRLMQQRRWVAAVANGFGMLLGAALAAAVGILLGVLL